MRLARAARRDPRDEAIEATLEEPKDELAAALLLAFAKVAAVPDETIRRARGNGAGAVYQVYDWTPFATLAAPYLAAGREAGRRMLDLPGLELAEREVVEQALSDWIGKRADRVLPEITAESQAALRLMLDDHGRRLTQANEMLLDLRNAIGLDRRQAVALQRLHRTLEEPRVEPMLEAFKTRSRAERAMRIASTEIQRSAMVAESLAYVQAGHEGQVNLASMRKQWRIGGPNPCERCLQLAAQDPIGFNESFFAMTFTKLGLPRWMSAETPPLHPSCACFVEYVGG